MEVSARKTLEGQSHKASIGSGEKRTPIHSSSVSPVKHMKLGGRPILGPHEPDWSADALASYLGRHHWLNTMK